MKSNYIIAFILVVMFLVPSHSPAVLHPNQVTSDLKVNLNLDHIKVRTGDTFDFVSTITNNGTDVTEKLILAINIVNLQDGSPVDPEDWSPLRTQFVNSLSVGQQATKTWTIFPILKGDYLIYLVVIPIPNGEENTSIPISSQAIHLTVTQFTRLNPKGILPLLIIMPIVLIVIFVYLRWNRHKSVTR